MDKYVIIGNPISQSKSPLIHTLFAHQTGQAMTYEVLQAPVENFNKAITAFFANGGRGCNVTVPFKEDAYGMATMLTERARLAGAVNTLKNLDERGILGDNTDGEGLVQDLLNHHVQLKDAKVLLLGAGGAARGVILPLLMHIPETLVIANRTVSKAKSLVSLFSGCGRVSAATFHSLHNAEFDIIINSTSASLFGEYPNIPASAISNNSIVYDMVYGPGVTSSNQWALAQGASRVIDGLGMLISQAAESFTVWRSIRPITGQVLRELHHNISE
ncbi:shikimate dehydrogenase [Candidatus Enterovibrio altilux]|uniref:Shikimate dehydrogenase (NADP(+)) n=1 Tax=Candidatus Enterovibrio altilux TaxID=1927128 RepID=A0A291BAS9_9GAMM|nr:shikimate dehydrogenase [Candidatus Enterovibrio luxaltus]ATF10094.1 Shikimate 5-dehydrogenase I alpha [Candidatus Enterovibrio luxaltus]